MNKLKTWWYVFKNSITNFSYYRDILKTPLSFSLKYLYVLVYAVITLQALIWSIQIAFLLPQFPAFLNTLERRMYELYPENLVITIKDGVLSTNAEEPVFIDIPELQEAPETEHFITIDTEASIEAYLDYQTLFLVTDSEIVYPESDYEEVMTYEVIPLDSVEENATINKDNYTDFVQEVSSVFPSLPRLAPVILIIGTFILPLFLAFFVAGSHLFLLFFLSIATWAIATLFKLKLGYMKSFQLGVHALTFPILLQMVLQMSGRSIPLVFISGFLLWMVLVLSQIQEVLKAE